MNTPEIKPRTVLLILLAILLGGLALRLGGINFRMYIDETNSVYCALKFGSLNYQDYLGVHTPILFLFYAVYFLVGLLTGVYQSLSDFLGSYFAYNPGVFLYGRFVESLAATASIWVTYRLGKKLFSPRAGLVAALFLATSYVHVYISQMVRGQAFSLLFLVAAFYFMVRMTETRRYRDYLLSGLLIGMALSIRVNLVPIVFTLVLAHCLAEHGRGRKFPGNLADHRLLVALFLVPVIYVASRPEIAQEIGMYRDLLQSFSGQTSRYVGAHAETSSYLYYLSEGFPFAFGWIYYGLFLAGVIFACFRIKRKQAWMILSFVVPYFLVMGKSNIGRWRYLFPLAPFAALLSAWLLVWLVGTIKTTGRRNAVLAVASLLLALEGVGITLERNRIQTLPRTQNISREWIFENIPSGARIAADSMGEQGPDLKWRPVIDVWIYNLDREELKELYENRTSDDPSASMALRHFIDTPPDPHYYLFNLGLREMVDLPLLKENRVEYAVVSSSVRRTYESETVEREFPEFHRARMDYYDWLERKGEIIKSFEPDENTTGPRIDIYQLTHP